MTSSTPLSLFRMLAGIASKRHHKFATNPFCIRSSVANRYSKPSLIVSEGLDEQNFATHSVNLSQKAP
ncbi:hypothetical protein L484_019324 [Morus notabilis]|uniref:Uncharacterized protein n=1 Tax=Morus notabilis TaxID=981085 RepID=W9RAY9_9ROSA|nr:hypothetical protein L484_019324 [Morus notabilis]